MDVKGYNGSVSFDGETVTIRKKMRGEVQIPVSQIGAVALIPAGLGMKGVRFSVAGGTGAHVVKPVGNHRDVAQDPYALTFRSKRAPEFEALVNEVNAARSAR